MMAARFFVSDHLFFQRYSSMHGMQQQLSFQNIIFYHIMHA